MKLQNYYENHQTSDSVDRWKNIEEFVSGISEYESMNNQSDFFNELLYLSNSQNMDLFRFYTNLESGEKSE